MKKIGKFVFAVPAVVIIFFVLLMIPQKKIESIDVATTIFPLQSIAENIGLGAIDVQSILPPGASPHTFELTPSVLREIGDAKVLYAIGNGLDDWTNNIADSSNIEIITVDSGITLLESNEGDNHHEEDDDHDEDHHHGNIDPHYFLTIPNAKIIAKNIADDLSIRFPEHKEIFAENLNNFLLELDQTDKTIRAMISQAPNKNIITMHDAWFYFAKEYNLNIVGTFEPSAGREPTPQYLVDLTNLVELSGVSTIFTEPQFSDDSISEFVRDNNLQILELDPLGGVLGSLSYKELMIKNAKEISKNN